MDNKPGELRQRAESFHHALAGIKYVLRTQHNAWIHGAIMFAAIGVGLWLGLSTAAWAVLVLTFALVWVAEFFNTAVEAAVDLTMPEQHPLARVAKDVAAGSVLVAAVGAVLIGLLLLAPPLCATLAG